MIISLSILRMKIKPLARGILIYELSDVHMTFDLTSKFDAVALVRLKMADNNVSVLCSKRRRGRPQKTDSEKKKQKRVTDAKWQKSRINIGSELDRWSVLKEQLELQSNSEMTKLLLDR